MTTFGRSQVPTPRNEPVKGYAPGSPERASLQAELGRQRGSVDAVHAVIGGERVGGSPVDQVEPHAHGNVLAKVHRCTRDDIQRAVDSCCAAQHDWARQPFDVRAGVFLKAAELLAGPWRDRINAACMLNQSKTCHQAEIDAACELIDFFRFNASYAQWIYEQQPQSAPGIWNRTDYRPLEGFVYCPTPFNFASIAANLPAAPALLGNVCIWKPAASTVYVAYALLELMEAAGLPPGVINLVTGSSSEISEVCLGDARLAGVHFTGSTPVFQSLWKSVANHIEHYKSYPRLVGETGGKDFVFVHPSSDVDSLVTALVRGAFEYQGQKCSAASRAYIPRSLWAEVKDPLVAQTAGLTMGDVTEFSNYLGAVIDRRAFDKISGYQQIARDHAAAEILAGGGADDSVGYFIEPTVVATTDPHLQLMTEEIFGPILTVYVYEDSDLNKTLELCDTASPYALTGAIFGRDRVALEAMSDRLRNAAGNFYLNDKPTGAVVGQQPFGGGRASGTNDKAGSYLNLVRWLSPRSIKENFNPPTDYRYPFLG